VQVPPLNRREVRLKVERAIQQWLKRDRLLLELDVNERSITHKLAEHLQNEFSSWNVDCEYNRKGNAQKKLPPELLDKPVHPWDTDGVTVFPDIIVHKRNTKSNLVVIEVKKDTNRQDSQWDLKKLHAFRADPHYAYEHAISVVLQTGASPRIKSIKLVNL
jgi:hypothetical protein